MTPHAYCNSYKKSSSCYKDFGVEECLFPKRCYPSSEEIWTCYPAHSSSNFTKKKDDLEAVPKSRKKLSIIDPATGKNILEGVSGTESCADYLETDSFETDNYHSDATENRFADYYCGEDIDQHLQATDGVYGDTTSCSTPEDAIYCDKVKDVPCETDCESMKTCENNLQPPVPLKESTLSSTTCEKEDPCPRPVDVMKTSMDKSSDKIDNAPKVHENSGTKKLFSEQVPKGLQTNESNRLSDGLVSCQSHLKGDCCSHGCKESTPKQSDCMKEGVKQLKEKIYSLRQEQQKMAILQSFLRYKKYQLEESARNLDEKRIEIANWECNLYSKAKRLQEKDQWLQNKSEMLYEKAVKLAHREKILNSQEDMNSSSSSKNTSLKKLLEDYERDISWESTSSKNRSSRNKETGDNEFSYYGQSSKIAHSSPALSVSKCKSVISSLDQLEKNIVMIEKIHSSKEIGDNCLDVKPESIPSHSTPNKSENVSEPLGQSKGRRYLPEHIKYWLNKRDKSAL